MAKQYNQKYTQKQRELLDFCHRASDVEKYLKTMNRGSNLQELKRMLERQQELKNLDFHAKMVEDQPNYAFPTRISRETTQGMGLSSKGKLTKPFSSSDVLTQLYQFPHCRLPIFPSTQVMGKNTRKSPTQAQLRSLRQNRPKLLTLKLLSRMTPKSKARIPTTIQTII